MNYSDRISNQLIDTSGSEITSKVSKQHKNLIKLTPIMTRGEDEIALESQD